MIDRLDEARTPPNPRAPYEAPSLVRLDVADATKNGVGPGVDGGLGGS